MEKLVQGTAEAPTMAGIPVDPDANTGLAYALDPHIWDTVDYPVEPEHNHFRTGVVTAAAAALAVIIGAMVVLFAFHRVDSKTVTQTLTVPAPIVAAQPDPPIGAPAVPPDMQRESHQTPDERYLKLFTQLSTLIVTDPIPIIAMGRAQCDYLSQPGSTPHGAAAAVAAQYSAVTRQMAYGIVEAAVEAYCPQYEPEL